MFQHDSTNWTKTLYAMKKTISILLIAFASLSAAAQDQLYKQLVQLIQENNPQVKTDNKLIAVNFWSIKDLNSREANKAFNKAVNVYEVARLKGGLKGLIAIAVCTDGDEAESVIVLNKDGNTRLIPLKNTNFHTDLLKPGNWVFDSQGVAVYSNLQTTTIFNAINQLITR